MEKFWQKHRHNIIALTILMGVFFVTRLVNLTLIPIFTDEAIYLRWSQIMANDASLRYLPLVDGKPPLFMWLTAIGLRLLPALDPLLVSRLVSVGSGLFGLAGIFFASYQLFRNRKIAYYACVFYLLSPFTLFYDRFGLADSLLAAFGIWSLGLSIMLVKKIRLDIALLLGITIGLGLLTKTPALFFYFFLPLSLFLFDWNKGAKVNSLLKLLGLSAIVIILSQAIFSILRLFPLFHMISQKNAEFSVSLTEILRHPFSFFAGNAPVLLRWEIGYLTVFVTVVVLYGAIFGIKKYSRQVFLLLMSFFGLFFYLSLFNKSIFPRFLLTFTPELLILASIGLSLLLGQFHRKLFVYTLGVILFLPSLFADFKLLSDPATAPIPDGDSFQYINRWPAGFGVKEIRSFFAHECKTNSQITVGTEGTFGLMPYALEIYQNEYPCLKIKSYWPLSVHPPTEILEDAKKVPTFFVIYQDQNVPPLWHLELVAKYQQGIGPDFLRLYKVLP